MARAARKEPTVRELDERLTKVEGRLDAIEGQPLGPRLDRLEQTVRENYAEHNALINLLLKQRSDDRALADQRHNEIMAQFEKLQAKPPEH
jgi:hypothetical protein